MWVVLSRNGQFLFHAVSGLVSQLGEKEMCVQDGSLICQLGAQ